MYVYARCDQKNNIFFSKFLEFGMFDFRIGGLTGLRLRSPSTSTADDNIEAVKEIILENRRVDHQKEIILENLWVDHQKEIILDNHRVDHQGDPCPAVFKLTHSLLATPPGC